MKTARLLSSSFAVFPMTYPAMIAVIICCPSSIQFEPKGVWQRYERLVCAAPTPQNTEPKPCGGEVSFKTVFQIACLPQTHNTNRQIWMSSWSGGDKRLEAKPRLPQHVCRRDIPAGWAEYASPSRFGEKSHKSLHILRVSELATAFQHVYMGSGHIYELFCAPVKESESLLVVGVHCYLKSASYGVFAASWDIYYKCYIISRSFADSMRVLIFITRYKGHNWQEMIFALHQSGTASSMMFSMWWGHCSKMMLESVGTRKSKTSEGGYQQQKDAGVTQYTSTKVY